MDFVVWKLDFIYCRTLHDGDKVISGLGWNISGVAMVGCFWA